jgi:hypothetical protein
MVATNWQERTLAEVRIGMVIERFAAGNYQGISWPILPDSQGRRVWITNRGGWAMLI